MFNSVNGKMIKNRSERSNVMGSNPGTGKWRTKKAKAQTLPVTKIRREVFDLE